MTKNNYLLVVTDKLLNDNDILYRIAGAGCNADLSLVVNTTTETLSDDVVRYKPKCLLVIGQSCANYIGLPGTLKSLRGVAHDVEIFTKRKVVKTKAVVAWSSNFIENAPNNLVAWAKDILRAWNISQGITSQVKMSEYKMVTNMKEVRQLIDYVLQVKECCFDFETSSLEESATFAEGFYATLLSISFQHGASYTIPLFHFESPFTEDEVMTILRKFSELVWQNPNVTKIAHNIKFDMHVSARYGFPIFRGRLVDTMLQHHLLCSYKRHGLKEAILDYYPQYEGYEDEVRKYGWEKVPLSVLAPYGGTDTDLTFRLYTIQENMLLQDEQLYRIQRNQTSFCIRPLYWAEEKGMEIDRELLVKYIDRARQLLAEQEQKLRDFSEVKRFEVYAREKAKQKEIAKLTEHADKLKSEKGKQTAYEKIRQLKSGAVSVKYDGINFGSPDQVGSLLYSEAGFGYPMPYVKAKRGQAPATDQKYLKLLTDNTGFIKELTVYRTIKKNLETYLEGFLPLLDKNNRIHTSYLIHGTVTGRLASRSPNLQNISKHIKVDSMAVEEVVSMIMKVFSAPKRKFIIQGDFSQAELRIIADLGKVKTMIQAYKDGMDLHAVTAANMLSRTNTDIETVEDFMRKDDSFKSIWRFRAKAANFGLIYKQGVEGFKDYAFNSYGVVLTLDEAADIRRGFFSVYPEILDYHDLYIAKAMKFGYVRTLFGRKRFTPNILSDDEYIRASEERDAVNHPVQGTCGEMTIFSFSLLYYRLPQSVDFVNTVHDSIVFYSPKRLVQWSAKVIKETSENLPTKKYFGKELQHLKLKVDVEVSNTNWKQLKEYSVENWKEYLSSCIPEYVEFVKSKKK